MQGFTETPQPHSSATATIVIPARWASTRYPAKPLAMIRGACGGAKTLLARSIEGAARVGGAHCVVVATDDARIAEEARRAGVNALITPESCRNGTERVAAALPQLDGRGVIVNFQGDALLTPPTLVEGLIAHMDANPDCAVATAAVRCSTSAYRLLVADQSAGRVGGTTVVTNAAGNAMYFSKRVLPHIAPGCPEESDPPVLLHLGLYAYRADALEAYAALSPAPSEVLEGLEQLRFLHHGIPVAVCAFDPPAWDVIELNNPSDLPLIEAILEARGIA